jgi:hypothetical protein
MSECVCLTLITAHNPFRLGGPRNMDILLNFCLFMKFSIQLFCCYKRDVFSFLFCPCCLFVDPEDGGSTFF